jgi:carboxylesterase
MEDLRARVDGRPIAICGFSMGGLLALKLARLYPERISALVVMGVPLRLRRRQVMGIRMLSSLPFDFRKLPNACVPKLNGSDISDPEMRYTNPGLRAFPIAALSQLVDLMDSVRRDLPSIRTPTLVVHGRQDHVAPMEDSLELTGCLGSDVIERLWLEKSFHVVTLDVERGTVIEGALEFLSRNAGWSVAA